MDTTVYWHQRQVMLKLVWIKVVRVSCAKRIKGLPQGIEINGGLVRIIVELVVVELEGEQWRTGHAISRLGVDHLGE